MTSTALMREAWAPHCKGPYVRISMHGEGFITVRASTAHAWRALNDIFIKHNYRTRKADTGAYNCRPVTGGRGYSLHAYAIASDFNWLTNPYGPKLITDMPMAMIEEIEALRTNSGHRVFRWGGRYSGNKDAMHFEIICTPEQLATGIKPINKVVPTPIGPEEIEDYIMMLAKSKEDAAELFVRKTFDELRLRAPTYEELTWFVNRTLKEGVSAVWTTIRDEKESQDILAKRRQDIGLLG